MNLKIGSLLKINCSTVTLRSAPINDVRWEYNTTIAQSRYRYLLLLGVNPLGGFNYEVDCYVLASTASGVHLGWIRSGLLEDT
jgi:hypothetical protein